MKIWSAWIQGRANAPPLVQKIFSLWEKLNPEDDFHVVENDEAQSIISGLGIDYRHLTPQVKANILRMYLLKTYGGLWVDATLLPVKPISQWLNGLTGAGFFAFRSTGNPDLVLQNWMLYSEPGHPFIKEWFDLYTEYFRLRRYCEGSRKIFLTRHFYHYILFHILRKRRDPSYFADPNGGRGLRIYPYAMHNYTLAHLLKTRSEMELFWSKVPCHFHIRPTIINYCSLDAETNKNTFSALASDLLLVAPVHKLNSHDERFMPMIERAVSDGTIRA